VFIKIKLGRPEKFGMDKILKALLIPVITFCFISCREEVISPGTLIGVKNLAVRDNYRNYYNFKIEAEEFTVTYLDSLRLLSTASLIDIGVENYRGGEVDIVMISEDGTAIVEKKGSDNFRIQFFYEGISRIKFVSCRVNQFSANLIVSIRRTN